MTVEYRDLRPLHSPARADGKLTLRYNIPERSPVNWAYLVRLPLRTVR